VPLARWYSAEVTVLHVYKPYRRRLRSSREAPRPRADTDLQRIEKGVHRFAAPLLASDVPSRTEIREGTAVTGVLDAKGPISP
jgi:hypothetical protein